MKLSTYKNYLLYLLMTILALTYVERMVFGVIQQSIKTDLHLSDTQLGILTGLAFTVFFSAVGIPIARWTDRGNRVTIVALSTAVWGATVALCASAGSFLQLLLIRAGLAAGEAGVIPPANSLIPDYFSRAERPRAVARFYMGTPLGLTVGAFAGGWLNQLYGWRMTLIILGMPGIVLALVAKLTLQEPRCDRNAHVAEATEDTSSHGEAPPLKEVLATLWSSTTFRHLMACFLIWFFAGWAIVNWQPTFFIRSHGLQTGELGSLLAIGQGGARLLGTWLGGEWGSRCAAKNERLQLLGAAVLFVCFAVFNAIAFMATNKYVAFGAVALGALGEGATSGPLFSTIQTLVPPRMRGMAIVVISLFPAFIGNGFGPLAVGALSDALAPMFGTQSLRYALVLFCPGYIWAAFHFWRASRTIERDIAKLHGPAAVAAAT